MMELSAVGLSDGENWTDISVPSYDWKSMSDRTLENPTWLHFGAGNIFRGFIAGLQHQLLEENIVDTGILAIDTFDFEIIDKIYTPFDCMTLLVALKADGNMEKSVISSVAKGIRGGFQFEEDMILLKQSFMKPSLQLVSFTVTEKGYSLQDLKGNFFPFVEADFKKGPESCGHVISLVTSLLWGRFQENAAPIAMVSMDNCSHNGEKLKKAVVTVAKQWNINGFVTEEFILWLEDETKVSFPWSMIDKITPRPATVVEEHLTALGFLDMKPIVTEKNTFIAPFVNAEIPQYLVIEDRFPNGRPPLEKAGVFFTTRETVNDTEKMKVTTCLNPLHTALAVFGCLLEEESIASEMKNPCLKKLVEGIGYIEGLPVVVDPKILNPETFIREVIEQRLPNPFIPDTPQRIATDTSQKVGIRFGETIKSYVSREDLEPKNLKFIPLAIAGWLRYLLGIADSGNVMLCSPDPMLVELQEQLSGIILGDSSTIGGKLDVILSNEYLFGCDLMSLALGEKIKDYFAEMIQGTGAVSETLKKYCS